MGEPYLTIEPYLKNINEWEYMRIEDTRSQYLKNQGFYSSIIWILASIKL